jgi:P27 family predicted phage terminase small subunit
MGRNSNNGGGNKPIPVALLTDSELVDKTCSISNAVEKRQISNYLTTKTVQNNKLKIPNNLSPIARKEYKKLIDLFSRMDISLFDELDTQALSNYCEAYNIKQLAQNEFNKKVKDSKGSIFTDQDSKVVDRLINIMEKQTKIMVTLSEQLCMTPTARARMANLIASKNLRVQNPIEILISSDEED